MTKNPQNITVIGAGIHGLVATNYVARAGHRVTLLERSEGEERSDESNLLTPTNLIRQMSIN